jgi:hypothetical protein
MVHINQRLAMECSRNSDDMFYLKLRCLGKIGQAISYASDSLVENWHVLGQEEHKYIFLS